MVIVLLLVYRCRCEVPLLFSHLGVAEEKSDYGYRDLNREQPSARRGLGIVSMDRNVRSKYRCSCVLQFTR